MITIDDKTYRNLQEQVGFNTKVINELIKNTFLNIKGLVNTIGELPTTDIADGTFYLVGITKPYQLYIYFENKWINLGDFKVEAIDGKNGEQGVPGHTPVITIGNNLNWFIDGVDTGVTAKGQNGISIRGPQGIRGEIGPIGPQGDPGINAFQFTIIDEITSTDDLPSPLGTPRNYAYLVNNDLYIIIGDNSNLMWKNVGQLGGVIIQNYTVGNPEGEASTTLTKLQIDDKIFSVVSKGSDLFNTNQLAAINSGITSDSVTKIQNNTESINIINQNVNELASTVESNKNDINSKVDELATATESALAQYNQMINSKQPLLVSGTNIKTINGQSILGSGNLNLLKDQKLDVDIECDHEYEITGKTGHEYSVAIEDSQMLLKKIQGQSRRYSLNLCKLPDTPETTQNGITYSIKDGVIYLNGTATSDLELFYKIASQTRTLRVDLSFVAKIIASGTNNFNAENTEPRFIFCNNDASYTWGIKFDNTSFNWLQAGSLNYDLGAATLYIRAGDSFTNASWRPMILEGNYTERTLPTFQPYDDTLVNSKCNLISTGRNLFNLNTAKDNTTFISTGVETSSQGFVTSDYIPVIPNSKYYLSVLTVAVGFDDNKQSLGYINNASSNISITIPNNCYFIKVRNYNSNSNITRLKETASVVYGDTAPTEYEQYIEDSYQVNTELGKYDYIDNEANLIVRQTSDVITIDGSADENWVKKEYVSNAFALQLPDDADPASRGETNSSLFAVANGLINSRPNAFKTVDALKSYLKSNPVNLIYKLATPTTNPIYLPAGYAVYSGGLQQQVIKGKYLPYKLSKLYSISVPSQILANIKIDQAQQDIIDNDYRLIGERIDRVVQGINAQIAQINERLSQLEG